MGTFLGALRLAAPLTFSMFGWATRQHLVGHAGDSLTCCESPKRTPCKHPLFSLLPLSLTPACYARACTTIVCPHTPSKPWFSMVLFLLSLPNNCIASHVPRPQPAAVDASATAAAASSPATVQLAAAVRSVAEETARQYCSEVVRAAGQWLTTVADGLAVAVASAAHDAIKKAVSYLVVEP